MAETDTVYTMHYSENLNRCYFKFNGFWRDTTEVPNLVDDWLYTLDGTSINHTILFDFSELRAPPKEVGELITKLLEASSKGAFKIAALIPEENSVVKLAVSRWVKDAKVEEIFESFTYAREAERWLEEEIEKEHVVLTPEESEKQEQLDKIDQFAKEKEKQVEKEIEKEKVLTKTQTKQPTSTSKPSPGVTSSTTKSASGTTVSAQKATTTANTSALPKRATLPPQQREIDPKPSALDKYKATDPVKSLRGGYYDKKNGNENDKKDTKSLRR